MKGLTHIAGCLLFFVCDIHAQNLVTNPGFESHTGCPTQYNDFAPCNDWSWPVNHSISPNYLHTCATGPSGAGVPVNISGTEWPATGNAYAGITLVNHSSQTSTTNRSYIQTQLSTALTAGALYKISLKYSLADAYTGAATDSVFTDALGIYLSGNPVVLATPTSSQISVTPQITSVLLAKKNGWRVASFDYTATGGEQYMLIGNFKDNLSTMVQPAQTAVLFYIDDVSVLCDEIICISGDNNLCSGESTTLTANPPANYSWATSAAPNLIIGNGPSVAVTPNGTTTYYAYNGNDTGAITVHVNTILANLGNDTVVCVGENLLLIAYQGGSFVSGTQYLWHNGNTTPFFTPNQSGTYWVQASLGGCVDADTINVIMNPNPQVDLGPDVNLCEGDTIILDATFPDAVYVWQDNSVSSTYMVTQAGVYSVEVSMGECTSSDQITIGAKPDPVFDLGDDIWACSGTQVILNASTANASYHWQDNSTDATYSPTQSGTYRVEVTLDGCMRADSVDVHFYPLPSVSLGNDTSVCVGDTILLDATQPHVTYAWQNDSNLPTFWVSQSGTYSVQVTDTNGCNSSDEIRVTYITAPVVAFADSVLCYGDQWVLDISAPYAHYLWQDKSELPEYVIRDEGVYWAMATNGCGSDSDTMEIGYRRCNCRIYVANGVTLDGDNLNEAFRPVNNPECELTDYTMTIFNRWGQAIFETQNIEYGWDGTVNHVAQPMGLYTYRVVYKYDKTPRLSDWGTIYLLR